MRRPLIPPGAMREILVNAFIHRDGAACISETAMPTTKANAGSSSTK